YRARGERRKPVEASLFGMVFELIPSDRGALVLRDPFSGELEALGGFDRDPQKGPIALDPGIGDSVFVEGKAITGAAGENWIAAPIPGPPGSDAPAGFLWLGAAS